MLRERVGWTHDGIATEGINLALHPVVLITETIGQLLELVISKVDGHFTELRKRGRDTTLQLIRHQINNELPRVLVFNTIQEVKRNSSSEAIRSKVQLPEIGHVLEGKKRTTNAPSALATAKVGAHVTSTSGLTIGAALPLDGKDLNGTHILQFDWQSTLKVVLGQTKNAKVTKSADAGGNLTSKLIVHQIQLLQIGELFHAT
mmetsp:Transcript_24835/g.71787  ORF Transcript_24835/g.71787 Transcript_24835/m.71787 type:complete len:203 (-) Transcript_24835:546-1154(-)